MVQFGGIVPLILGRHGHWHFCTRIRFDGADHGTYAHELLKLSLNYQDGKLLIREEREFCVDPHDPTTLLPLFECLYGNSVEGFSNPLSKQPNRIGFTV